MASAISGILVFWLYFPPKHPRGLPFKVAIKQLDYIGAILFTIGLTLTLTGITLTTTNPSSSPKVVATIVIGFATLGGFACWETFADLKQPLTPTHIFAKDKGREFTAPFIAGLIVTMYYFGTNVLWSVMIDALFVTPTSPKNYDVILTLPQGLANSLGAALLTLFGTWTGKKFGWKWTYLFFATWMVFWGGLVSLATPERKGMTISFIFFEILGYGWTQYLSIAYIQLGVDQHELGVAGGLAGTARNAGGAVAICVYSTILSHKQGSVAAKLVPAAVIKAGGSLTLAKEILAALPLGATALAKIKGATLPMIGAAQVAYQESYTKGLQ